MRNSKKIAKEVFCEVFNIHPSYANYNYTNYEKIIEVMFKYKNALSKKK